MNVPVFHRRFWRFPRFRRLLPFAAALLAVLVSACTSPAPVPRPSLLSLRVGFTPNYPPICMTDNGRPVGLEADLAEALAKELGCPLEIIPFEFDQLFPALLDGRVDILMAGLTVTPSRELKVKFCSPYLRNPLVAVTRAGKAHAYASAAAVLAAPTSVGVIRQTSAEIFVRRHCAHARVVPITFHRDVAQNLSTGRFTLYVDDLSSILDLVATHPEVLEVIPYPLHPQDIAWAVRPDNKALLAAANAAIAKWKADGRLDAMLDRWLPGRFW